MIIPFRDHWNITFRCLNSIESQATEHLDIMIVLANNQSKENETAQGIAQFTSKHRHNKVTCIEFKADYPFNFSKINNDAFKKFADQAIDYVLFTNNDIELSDRFFLEKLLDVADMIPELGALGSTLLYSNQKIQHIFLAPGIKIVGAHPLKGIDYDPCWEWFKNPRPVPAVTGALCLVRPTAFQLVGGFDENLPSVGQDLDLCLKFQKAGLTNWVAPHLVCFHHEGISRGQAIDRSQVKYMYAKWGDFLIANDYYSESISRWSEYPTLRWFEGRYPWNKVI